MHVVKFIPQEHKPAIYDNFSNSEPGLFLAGPIQGAPNWQAEALAFVQKEPQEKQLHVFNPRVDGKLPHSKDEQIRWEKYHLERAKKCGAILFWFAAQDLSLADYPTGRAYAQTSRIEFGRAMGWLDYDPTLNIVLGIDPHYEQNGGGNSEYMISCAEEHTLPVHTDLKTACRYAAKLALTSANHQE